MVTRRKFHDFEYQKYKPDLCVSDVDIVFLVGSSRVQRFGDCLGRAYRIQLDGDVPVTWQERGVPHCKVLHKYLSSQI
jgi:hypothetical protein